MLKLGHSPDAYTFSALMRGLCSSDRIPQAVQLFDQMVRVRCEPNVVSYGTIINGLCKIGENAAAIRVLRMMEGRGCPPNVQGRILDGSYKAVE